MKRRILSIITALALCLSLCPTWALAAEADPFLCKHHPEHTEDCGYTAPTEGHDCGHEHTEDCYTTDEAGGKVLDCHHSHDSECGYVQANPGTSCGYECRICPIEDLIAALPDTVTEDNAAIVRGQLDHILALYRELDEDEQEEINLSRIYALQEALDAANAPMQAAEETNISENLNNILTADEGDCLGHTFTGTAQAAMIYVESGAHNVTFSNLKITPSATVGIAPGATMNLTIEGTNTIRASINLAGIYVPAGATLIINGTGSLDVSGDRNAGIGGATYVPDENGSDGDPNCGTVEINGGTITATGGSGCAGIGGGVSADYSPGNGGTVTISGGTVTAKGGSDNYFGGAGIGGSAGASASDPAGNGGTLTINGGTVNLNAGTHDPQYPAYGFGQGSGSAPTGTCELTLADASYLTVDSLDPNGKYTINGDPTTDMIVVPEDLIYNGKAQELDEKIYIDDSKTGSAEYFGRTFSVKASADGWTYAINPSEVKAAGDYTVTFSKEGHTSISKIFTVAECTHAGATATDNGDGTHTLTCPACGGVSTANHTWDENGSCVCGAQAAAKAELDGAVIGYYGESNLASAFAAENTGATITLLDDVTTEAIISVYASNFILDLNGKTYTCTDTAIFVRSGSLTIKGSGAITASSFYCLNVYGGTLNIESGSFSGVLSAVVVRNGDLQLTGGSFTGGTSAIEYASGDVTAALANYGGADAPHYAFYQGSSPYAPSGSTLPSGTFTVGECQHEGVEVTDNGDGTHGLICPYCGYHSEHTTALTATASGSAVTLSEGCATCEYKKELGTVDFTFENLVYGNPDAKVTFTNIPAKCILMCQDKQRDDDMTEVSWTLAQLFGSTKVTVGEHKMKVSFVNAANIYSNECELTFSVAKAELTPSLTGSTTKPYDGTTDVVSSQLSITLTGVVGSDDVTAAATSCAYDNANAGENKTITASGITLGGADAGNYTLSSTTATTTGTITKSQPTIAFVSGYNPSKDYDSQTIPNPVEANLTITGANFSDVTFEWSATPKDAGTYTLTAKIAETNNTETAQTGPLSVTISPKAVTPTITITPSSYEYTGSAIHPSGNAVKVMDGDTVIPDSEYTLSYGENTQVGTGSVTVTDKENGNYTIAQTTETFTITKANQATLTITGAPSSVTYGDTFQLGFSGGSGSGALSWAASGATVDNAGNVTITRAGTVAITVGKAGDSNYSGTEAQIRLNVSKKALTVTGAAAQDRQYDGTSMVKITGVTLDGIVGSDAVSVDTADLTGTLNGSNAGSYTAVTLPILTLTGGGADNYTLTQPAGAVSTSVTISKADYTGTMTASTSGKYGREKTYDLSDMLPDGYKLGTITTTDTNSIFDGTPTVSGTTLTYKLVNDSQKVNSTGTITIPVTESTNYNSFDLTITVTVINVRIPNLTVNPISVTYTGSPVPDTSISGTATVDGQTIAGTWNFASGQNLTNVADSGAKSVVFNPTNTSEYGPATGTVTVTIRKATPSLTLTPSPATLPNGGTVTLTLSGLPSGGSATVTCSDASITVTKGSGSTWTADLPAGGAAYTFTASYSGDGNHNGATASCTVSVEKITPALSLTANPASLRGSGTATLTLSGLPAGGTAAVTCDRGITVTAGAGSTWTATLPNSTATYTFTASYAGNTSYNAASASCTVETTEVTVLPNPPEAGDGKQYQVVMEDDISEVPAGLQSIETLNTPEKLETAMKTAIKQANSGVPQANTAVYDVELQISTDGGATWTKATAGNFPANGLTVTLPYPAGTNSSYTFTVVHMFTTSDFNKTPGDTETPRVTNTASGLQFTVTGLSPISVGWVQSSTPTTPTGPTGGGGGGWSSSTYAVTVERAEHGKVTSNRTNANSGSTVTLTATPDSGYALDTLTVTDSRGSEIRLTAQGGGKYTFTMPSRAVTVKATFSPLPDDTEKPCDGGADCPSRGFTDLGTVGTWYHEAVDYVLRNNLMGGYGNGMFAPNDTLTRAQFAQILYNKEGRPAVTGGGIFADVAPGAWCAPAITWAAERGIVGGYGNGMFGPNDNITREQLAVMLWRYAGSPAATDKELHFNDADKASGFALDALRWAIENGIINGKGGGILDPKGLATRTQTAQMLKNFLKDE